MCYAEINEMAVFVDDARPGFWKSMVGTRWDGVVDGKWRARGGMLTSRVESRPF